MKDFFDLLTSKAYSMILITTGEMKMAKDSWAEIKMQYFLKLATRDDKETWIDVHRRLPPRETRQHFARDEKKGEKKIEKETREKGESTQEQKQCQISGNVQSNRIQYTDPFQNKPKEGLNLNFLQGTEEFLTCQRAS